MIIPTQSPDEIISGSKLAQLIAPLTSSKADTAAKLLAAGYMGKLVQIADHRIGLESKKSTGATPQDISDTQQLFSIILDRPGFPGVSLLQTFTDLGIESEVVGKLHDNFNDYVKWLPERYAAAAAAANATAKSA